MAAQVEGKIRGLEKGILIMWRKDKGLQKLGEHFRAFSLFQDATPLKP
ncbi:MAG: hypothetical protein JXA79_01160 [Deltaproteobacteria bacterium]|nr:hypothetical protein [Deltaproteobacteria bacterium]